MRDFIIENRILVSYIGKSKEVVVPKGITITGNKAFIGQEITKIIIPEGVATIGERAFYECVRLTEVILPESAKFIEQYAFGFCRNLRSITTPDSMLDIDPSAFKGCDHLNRVYGELTKSCLTPTLTPTCFKLSTFHSPKCFLKARKLDKSIEKHKEKAQIRAERISS